MMDKTDWKLLKEIADLEKTPRALQYPRQRPDGLPFHHGQHRHLPPRPTESRASISGSSRAPRRSRCIPVIIHATGFTELVYNDFFIGEDCDIDIVAGCGIHNTGCETAQHDGLHTFYIGKNSKVRYVERHYGEGEGTGERIFNPQTVVYLEEGPLSRWRPPRSRGVDSTKRDTKIVVGKNAEAVITESSLPTAARPPSPTWRLSWTARGQQTGDLRSVAQEESKQIFYPKMTGNNKCFGHVQCDSIIMGNAQVSSIPAIVANHVDAQLIHEAAIGRIAGDQLLKLMTLGLTEEEAEEKILDGFLQ